MLLFWGSAPGGLAATTLRGGAALAVGVASGARAALVGGGAGVPTSQGNAIRVNENEYGSLYYWVNKW